MPAPLADRHRIQPSHLTPEPQRPVPQQEPLRRGIAALRIPEGEL
jgi:hypothetical protein